MRPLPEEIKYEASLHELWRACAEEGAFEDGKTNMIRLLINPLSFSEIIKNSMRIDGYGVWQMGGGFYIKLIVSRVENYEIDGFGYYEM